jgi:hypothetical protein
MKLPIKSLHLRAFAIALAYFALVVILFYCGVFRTMGAIGFWMLLPVPCLLGSAGVELSEGAFWPVMLSCLGLSALLHAYTFSWISLRLFPGRTEPRNA